MTRFGVLEEELAEAASAVAASDGKETEATVRVPVELMSRLHDAVSAYEERRMRGMLDLPWKDTETSIGSWRVIDCNGCVVAEGLSKEKAHLIVNAGPMALVLDDWLVTGLGLDPDVVGRLLCAAAWRKGCDGNREREQDHRHKYSGGES